jgi:hypothetical protein
MRVPATIVVFVVLACTVNAQWRYRDPNAPRLPDGKIDVKAAAPRTPAGTVDLSGIWQTDVKYNFNLGADLKPEDIVMLPWAQALQAERRDNNGKDDPEGYCLPPGFPRVNGVPFPQKIVQLPGAIIILYETRTTFRQIFLDNNHTLPNDPQPTWMGYSKGRWDGDVLIVETRGFNDKTWLDDNGHPHSEQMKVTEQFRRPSFGQLLVDITIDDPKTYAKPWTVTQAFQLAADNELIEYICNENNLDVQHLVGK